LLPAPAPLPLLFFIKSGLQIAGVDVVVGDDAVEQLQG